MAYKTEELEKKALKAIKEHKLIFIEEVVSFLPCSKPTFYEHGLNESNAIKEAIEANKIATKTKLRRKWEKSDNATLNLAAYKLCASDKELEKLTMQKTKTEVSGEVKQHIDLSKLSNEELERLESIITNASANKGGEGKA